MSYDALAALFFIGVFCFFVAYINLLMRTETVDQREMQIEMNKRYDEINKKIMKVPFK